MRWRSTLALTLLSASVMAQAPAPVTSQPPVSDRQAARVAASPAAYDEWVTKARASLKANDANAALAASRQAIALDDRRWEAYLTAASALSSQSMYEDAVSMLQSALARAPDDRKPLIRDALASTRQASSLAQPKVAASAAPSIPSGPTQAEVVLWKSIENSRSASDFSGYLDRYPDGTFATVAKARLAALRETSKSPDERAAELVAKIVAMSNNVRARGETQSVFASGCVLSVVRAAANRSSTQTIDLRRADESSVQVTNEAGTWAVAGMALQNPAPGGPATGNLRAADQATVGQLFALVPEAIRACKGTVAAVAAVPGPAATASKAVPVLPVFSDRRQAAFAGGWKCTERTTLDYRREGRTVSMAGTKYYEITFDGGRFAVNRLVIPADEKIAGDLIDGVARTAGEGDYAVQESARWDGEAIVVDWTNKKGFVGTRRFQVAGGKLTIDQEHEDREDGVRVTGHHTCDGMGVQEASDAVRRIRAEIRSAVDDAVRFAQIAALKSWNIRGKAQEIGFCEISWTGPGFSLNEPEDQELTLIPSIVADFRVMRGRYSDAYVFSESGTFWFGSPDQAGRFIQLARKATELCNNWP